MEKINFINNSIPAINDVNLNKLQDNVENAISELRTEQNNKVKTSTTTSDTDTYCCNYINNLKVEINSKLSYSNEETIVGTWFGKPLYRKTVYISSLPNASEQGYDSGIPKATTTYRFINGMFDGFPINFYYGVNPNLSIGTYIRNDNSVSATNWVIDINVGSNRSSVSGYVNVYYTKNTD